MTLLVLVCFSIYLFLLSHIEALPKFKFEAKPNQLIAEKESSRLIGGKKEFQFAKNVGHHHYSAALDKAIYFHVNNEWREVVYMGRTPEKHILFRDLGSKHKHTLDHFFKEIKELKEDGLDALFEESKVAIYYGDFSTKNPHFRFNTGDSSISGDLSFPVGAMRRIMTLEFRGSHWEWPKKSATYTVKLHDWNSDFYQAQKRVIYKGSNGYRQYESQQKVYNRAFGAENVFKIADGNYMSYMRYGGFARKGASAEDNLIALHWNRCVFECESTYWFPGRFLARVDEGKVRFQGWDITRFPR